MAHALRHRPLRGRPRHTATGLIAIGDTAGGRRWTPGAIARRAREVLAGEGVRALWFKMLGETVYRRLLLMECALDPPPPLRPPLIELAYGFLSPDDVGDLRVLPPDAVPADALSRLRRGHRCWVARHRGRIVAARWLAEGTVDVGYLGCTLRMDAGEVYIYQAFTDPAFRNHGVSAASIGQLARTLALHGRTKLVTAVGPENRASRRALANGGYRRAGVAGFVQLGPWRYQFVRRTVASRKSGGFAPYRS